LKGKGRFWKTWDVNMVSRCSGLGISEDGKITAPENQEGFLLGSLVPKTAKLEKFVAVFRW